jgi:catechol 2,3-dioxygenase
LQTEPIYDIAHLGHVEILTPKFDDSCKFFIDVLGMTRSGEKGDSVYLRGWDDYERYSLKLTASKTSGLGHCAFRSPQPAGAGAARGRARGLGLRRRLA